MSEPIVALLSAIDQHNLEEVKSLLAEGVSPNKTSDKEPRLLPLDLAITELEFGAPIELVKLLIDAGASIRWPEDLGYQPIHPAVDTQNRECVRLLLQHGADPNAITDEGESALLYAVQLNDYAMIELLLQSGVRKTIDHFGGIPQLSPLTYAVRELDLRMIKLLLQYRANPMALDEDCRSAFSYLPEVNEHNFLQINEALKLLNSHILFTC